MLKKVKTKIALFTAAALVVISMFSNVSAETTTLFQDNFESGNTNLWSKSGGTWSVITDGTKALKQSGISANAFIYAGQYSWTNYSIEAKVKPLAYNGSNRYISLLARYKDSSNYYSASIGNTGKLNISKKASGSTTVLASKDYPVSTNTWYTVKLSLDGSNLNCYVDGVLALSATDSSLTAGKIGMNTYYSSAEFDDVLVASDSSTEPTPTTSPSTPTPTPQTPTPTPQTPTPTPPTPTPTPTPTTTPSPREGDLYVSPSGDDANSGSVDQPLKTLHYAVSVVQPGNTIYMRGGTYKYTSTVSISRSGTASQPITICAFPGETPILNYSDWKPATESIRGFSRGITITGDYWHIKGLDICYSPDNGIKLEGSNNTIELCVFHHNGDTGLQIGLVKGASNDGTKVANNLILNCDSYRNSDPATSYENADGFACKLYPGIGNRFYGCRAWENCDDGWDFYMTTYQIVVENCWTWHNGDPSLWGFSSFNGDGNGFKLGGDGEAAPHLIKNCVAFDSPYGAKSGFNDNNNGMAITLLNCTAWACGNNFRMEDQPHVLKNCVAFDPKAGATKNAILSSTAVQANNTWNLTSVTADYNDFISTNVNDAKAARQADGSLPDNGFAKLKTDSDLIDKGVDVGLPYLGTAPDLGAYECR